MGVYVDEAGAHDLSRGVELPFTAEPVAHGDDPTTGDGHVRSTSRSSRPVYDGPSTYDDFGVGHDPP